MKVSRAFVFSTGEFVFLAPAQTLIRSCVIRIDPVVCVRCEPLPLHAVVRVRRQVKALYSQFTLSHFLLSDVTYMIHGKLIILLKG